MSQIVNHVMQLRSVVDDMNRRLVALERSAVVREAPAPPPTPAPAPEATPDSRTIEDVQEQLAADVRTEVRSAVAKEKLVIETTLGYKLEQSVSRLVKDRVEQLRSDLEAAVVAATAGRQGAAAPAPAPSGEEDEAAPAARAAAPAQVEAASTDGIVMKKKKSKAAAKT